MQFKVRSWASLVSGTALVERQGVAEGYSISGEYDLLAKCYLDDGKDIGHLVTNQIQNLAGVRDTYTTIRFNAFTRWLSNQNFMSIDAQPEKSALAE